MENIKQLNKTESEIFELEQDFKNMLKKLDENKDLRGQFSPEFQDEWDDIKIVAENAVKNRIKDKNDPNIYALKKQLNNLLETLERTRRT